MQGQEIPIQIHMSTSHWGRFELRVCPLSDPSLTTEYKELNEVSTHPDDYQQPLPFIIVLQYSAV